MIVVSLSIIWAGHLDNIRTIDLIAQSHVWLLNNAHIISLLTIYEQILIITDEMSATKGFRPFTK